MKYRNLNHWFILETAVGLSKEMQDFESESVAEGTDHSQRVKAVLEQSDCGSKGCVYLPDPIAVSRFIPKQMKKLAFGLKRKLYRFLLSPKANFFICLGIMPTVFGANWVTCDIYGQLGNQMFQVAASISYALDHGAIASFPEIKQAINGDLNLQYVLHRINTFQLPENTEFYYHDHNRITDTFIYAPIPDFGEKNIHLHAHFCSEKYFEKHADIIRQLFAPTQELVEEIRSRYKDLLDGPTVAIHVRTFLPDHHLYPLHIPNHLLSFRWYYYTSAMNLFPSHFRFLVFSDDPKWTEKNFPRTHKNVTFIQGNPHYFDFYFISLCDHQIVSYDSTYSWWAAWLNPNPNKIVIIPDTAGNIKNGDLLPESWIKLPRYPSFILETAVGLSKEMQDFESESVAEGTDHSQMVKAVLEQSDCGSKGCVYLPDPIAVSRFIKE